METKEEKSFDEILKERKEISASWWKGFIQGIILGVFVALFLVTVFNS